jgi:circadian clock protein KaiC
MPARRRKTTRRATPTTRSPLAKAATGIDGFDRGGLPRGRPTLVCGGPGCGKTLFALEFLVHGAIDGESGVFVTFEETEEDIAKNVASLGYDVADLIRRKRPALEYIRVERSEIEETGEYDLEEYVSDGVIFLNHRITDQIIGDLSYEESVLVGLDLRQRRRGAGARP